MLQHLSKLKVADNSGAKKLQVIRVLGGYRKGSAGIGDVVTATVKEAVPRAAVKKSDIVHAVIVRTRKETRRSDGSYIRFDENAAVILEAKKEPKGGRIFGPIPREIKEKGYDTIASLAPEIV